MIREPAGSDVAMSRSVGWDRVRVLTPQNSNIPKLQYKQLPFRSGEDSSPDHAQAILCLDGGESVEGFI